MHSKGSAKAKTKAPASPFEFSGGALCLDFANTVNKRPTPKPQDLLADVAALAAWSREAGLLSERAVRRMVARAPAQSQAELRRARALREAIYKVCSALAAKTAPSAQQVAALNRSLSETLTRSKLEPRGDGFVWAHSASEQPLEGVLWAVAHSAANLLTSAALTQLRECAADTCGWLFLDRSKNGSRRWCDMRVCGNRAKVRRFRRRAGTPSRPKS